MFRAFVVLCRGLDLFGRELLAVDETRLKAVNNEDRNFTQAKLKRDLAKSDERLARYLEQLDEADQVDDDGPRSRNVDQLREKIKAIRERRDRLLGYRAQIESNGEGQLSLTDPDARGMPATSGVNVGYNIQIAVDVKHKLIVEQQVHNKVSDIGLLTGTAVAARKNLDVDQISAVADKGYPDPPRESSSDDDPIGMRLGLGAGPGEALGDGVEIVASIETVSVAGQVALSVLGADVMIGAGERGLDVAEHRVDPFEGCPSGRLAA